MKAFTNYLKIFMGVFVLAFGMVACDKEDYLIFTAQEPSEAISFENTASANYLLSAETKNNIAERFVWNKPDFGAPTTVSYTVEGSVSADFSTVDYDSGTLSETNHAILVNTLIQLAETLGLDSDPATTNEEGEPNNTGTVYFRVKAFVGSDGATNEVKSVSELMSMTITMVEKQAEGNNANCELDQLWIVGAGAPDAGWGWDTPVQVPCTGDGVYSANVSFQSTVDANNFRFFTTEGDWGSGQNYPYFADAGYTIDNNFENAMDGDSNFAFVGTTGTYNLTIDTKNLTITLAPPVSDPNCDLDQLWIVGAGAPAAGWGWDSPVQVSCTGEGTYSANVTLQNNGGADNNFRFFTTEGDWGSGQNYPYFADAGYTIDSNFVNAGDGDSNFAFIGVSGSYTLTVDTVNKVISLGSPSCEYDQLWIVGAGAPDAGWSWDTPVQVSCSGNGIYSANVTFQSTADANNFRFFTVEGDWGSGLNFPYFEGEGYTIDANFENAGDGDSNFAFVGADGTYILTVDTVNKVISLY
ncbi:SusE domain-containing protein [Zeaxanthinibacter sp. PT1]|uniref:SusE domain-containing protein n=1 Tax=Zeaxanthinibacter TaxID=561554 RepID=UPI00234A7017|nr:SusE domain-containing protein [Zeaxanthinibacter sp. PT1]MDC6351174.1 SusE domain-containing protein [Zeaxanthinibacter sp. PT1]